MDYQASPQHYQQYHPHRHQQQQYEHEQRQRVVQRSQLEAAREDSRLINEVRQERKIIN